jgi:hypothetical protein
MLAGGHAGRQTTCTRDQSLITRRPRLLAQESPQGFQMGQIGAVETDRRADAAIRGNSLSSWAPGRPAASASQARSLAI